MRGWKMEKTLPGANFDPDPETLKSTTLPDKGDIHVVATAIAAQARTIITYNVRDFPNRILLPLGLRVETPDAFCTRLFREAQADVVEGARLHRASLKKPSYDPGSYLSHLELLGFKRTAESLRTCQNMP